MAERVGFEPTIPLTVYKLSKLALSTAQPPLRNESFELNRILLNSLTHFNKIK